MSTSLTTEKAPAHTAAPARPARPLSTRKLALRVMLGTLGVSLALGFAGKGKAHVVTGLVFGALLTNHVWKRRKAL